MTNYTIEEKLPSIEEYIHLRKSVDWPYPNKTAIEKSLTNSNYCVCAIENDRIIGMSRIVGDDSFIFFIADVIVLPEYQKQGIGKTLMERTMSYLRENVQEYSYITLMCAKGMESFYEKFGFFRRPTGEYGCGMMVEL
ncbi:GNAT family N-acetyltransferase [Methanolobus halotolerans]|uniref:GNAT family N-acetyltransferase n=1 Tax=Methanolobus halotolerans TaxID=2052935 RepID=A0A4E0QRG4_9EURY|nr:GNAT family N-acetyltransferase [Methanolobus halotolerans]TGC09026.1 GNAT family N-acetyltransferase [Methanolobus halotolerans]